MVGVYIRASTVRRETRYSPTGIVLALEMTAAFSTLLPILVTSFAAMVAATLLDNPPIYDSLLRRLAKQVESSRE